MGVLCTIAEGNSLSCRTICLLMEDEYVRGCGGPLVHLEALSARQREELCVPKMRGEKKLPHTGFFFKISNYQCPLIIAGKKKNIEKKGLWVRPQAYTGLFSGFFGSVYRVFSRFFLVVLWAFCAGFSRLNYDFYLTFAQ